MLNSNSDTNSRGGNSENLSSSGGPMSSSRSSQNRLNRFYRSELGTGSNSQYDQYLPTSDHYNSDADNAILNSDAGFQFSSDNDNNNNQLFLSDNASGGFSSNYSSDRQLMSVTSIEVPTVIRHNATILPRETIMLFLTFFQTFTLNGDTKPFYIQQLHNVLISSSNVFALNVTNLMIDLTFLPLFEAMVYFPSTTIPIADFVINRLALDMREKWLEQSRLEQNERQAMLQNGHHSDDGLSSDARNIFGENNSMGSGMNLYDNEFNHIQTSPYHNQNLIIRPYNLALSSARHLQPEDIDGLISVRGMVLRVSPLKPELKIAAFICHSPNCNQFVEQSVIDGKLKQPNFCTGCNKKDTYKLDHNRSQYASKQVIRIQEVPEDAQEGETPHTLSICSYDDLVDCVKPGDRVVVTGIYRGHNIRLNPHKRQVNSSLFTYIDAFHFKMVSAATATSLSSDNQSNFITEDVGIGLSEGANGDAMTDLAANGEIAMNEADKDMCLMLSQRADIYSLLARSIAPSVWGLDDVKKGLLSLMVGGNNLEGESFDDGSGQMIDDDENSEQGQNRRGKRGSINVLLVGDPGTAKSQLLQYIHKLSTRGVYTSGTASSAAGLTASVSRDPIQNEMVLEPGALVISDGGICCIDEFDKMTPSAQSILHEAMEQQTVSIAKAGVICSLSARTSILASANPRDSRYNPSLSIVQNIDLPPTLVSRFDLIYIVLDTPNQASDQRLAQHLLQLFMSPEDRQRVKDRKREEVNARFGKKSNKDENMWNLPTNDDGMEYLPTSQLMKYINLARTLVPTFSDDACFELEDSYLELRGVSNSAASLGADAGRNVFMTDDGQMAASIRANGGASNQQTTISATTRQLQSLIRLSESLAKIHCRDVVTRDDVKEACRLIRTATLSAAIDPVTGRIDMNALNTGISTVDPQHISIAKDKISTLLTSHVAQRDWSFHQLAEHVVYDLRQFNQSLTREAIHDIVSRALLDLTDSLIDWTPGRPINLKR